MTDIFLIKKPLLTEKAVLLNKKGEYVFMVKPKATKNEIRKAVKTIYNVDVVKIQTINRPAKPRRFRNIRSQRSGYKKAIVTLKEGQKIEGFV